MSELKNSIGWSILKESSIEMIFLLNETGDIIDCSDAAKYGLGFLGSEVPGHFRDIFPTVELEDSQSKSYSATIYRKNETCFPTEMRIKKIKHGYLVFALDKTRLRMTAIELKNMREALLDSNKYRTEFVSNITHELRTPVNGIQGMVRTLLDTELTKKQKSTVKVIEDCCVSMEKIINNLLDFSKLELDRVILENNPFFFREFLNKVMDFNVTLINEKGLKFILQVDNQIPDLLIGDEFRLSQIVNNLINNAVKFTRVGNVVFEVTKIREGDDFVELFFMVMDTGIGIAKEDMDRLFKSFSQVDASTTRKFGGTGLGLSICKKLVEMMGGKIKVESELGKGSAFSFNIILTKAESGTSSGISYPTGNFIYEGNGQFDASYFSEEEGDKRPIFRDFATMTEKLREFKTINNISDIRNAMEKLQICIELENWEKAENFSGVIKNLISDRDNDKEIKKAAFKLELMVRREDKEKSMSAYKAFDKLLGTYYN